MSQSDEDVGLSYAWASGPTWVVSDVHSNAHSLKQAFSMMGDGDAVVFLGDLFTYGMAPCSTSHILASELQKRPIALVVGNHDQMYLDLYQGKSEYFSNLPEWIRESAEWTLQQLDESWVAWDWRKEFEADKTHFRHANANEFGDWSYLTTLADHRKAAAQVRGLEGRMLVVGHTHRPRAYVEYSVAEPKFFRTPPERLAIPADSVSVINAGSVGQPRDGGKHGSILKILRSETRIETHRYQVDLDPTTELDAIWASRMSENTKKRLSRFWMDCG